MWLYFLFKLSGTRRLFRTFAAFESFLLLINVPGASLIHCLLSNGCSGDDEPCSMVSHWAAENGVYKGGLHPGKLTWNIVIEVGKIIFLSNWVILRFHVNLPGCTNGVYNSYKDLYHTSHPAIRPFIIVVTPFTTARGSPCTQLYIYQDP